MPIIGRLFTLNNKRIKKGLKWGIWKEAEGPKKVNAKIDQKGSKKSRKEPQKETKKSTKKGLKRYQKRDAKMR